VSTHFYSGSQVESGEQAGTSKRGIKRRHSTKVAVPEGKEEYDEKEGRRSE